MSIIDAFRLDGKVAIVTGASSGLGVAIATALADAGADVVVAARRKAGLEKTTAAIRRIGGRALSFEADITERAVCGQIVDAAVTEFGRVDVLVNNAGVASSVPASKETLESARGVFDVNVLAPLWMAQACARVMSPGSNIINIGSILGSTTARLPQAVYCASKAAVIGLPRDLAQEWTGRKGIRVNAIAPGMFSTEMTAQYPVDYLERIVNDRIPAGRIGELRECAAAVVFLASDAASYISGALLAVDGGFLTT